MPVFSLALGEAEQYLEPLGFPGDGKLELSLLGFDDPTLKGDFRDKYHCAAPEGWAPWKSSTARRSSSRWATGWCCS